MQKDKITNGSGAAIAALTVMTNGYSMMFGANAGRDAWISNLIAGGSAVVLAVCFTKVCDKYPQKNFFEICTILFGTVLGKISTAILALLSIMTCVVSLTAFSRFVQITALAQTPQIILPLLIVIIAALSMRSGMIAASGSARLLFWFSVAVFVAFTFFGVRDIDFSQLVPIGANASQILSGAGEIFLNRFGVVAALTAVYTRMRDEKTRRKFFLGGIGGAAVMLTVISAITVATLGQTTAGADFYPVYTAMSVRGVGGFIRHTEILACIVMTLSLFFKCVVCLMFADDMQCGIFDVRRREGCVMPLALISAASTQIIYQDITSLRGMVEWKNGAWAVVVLYILIPVLLVLLSKIKGGNKLT